MGAHPIKEDPAIDPVIERELVENPFENQRSIAKRLGVNKNRVEFVQKRMGQKGRTRRVIRQELLAAFLRERPNGTVAEAADALKTDDWHILQTKGSSALSDAKEARLRIVGNAELRFSEIGDGEVVTAIRPESYVCEVVGAGYKGVCLPDEEFTTYLKFRELRKRHGDYRYVASQKDAQ